MFKSLTIFLLCAFVISCSTRPEPGPDSAGLEPEPAEPRQELTLEAVREKPLPSTPDISLKPDHLADLPEVLPDLPRFHEEDAAAPTESDVAAVVLTPEEQQALESEPEIHFDLDLRDTKEVQLYFKYYTHTHRKTFERWLQRAGTYLPYIRDYFIEQGLPHDLVFLPFAESGFNPLAYSHASAAGLWQFIPGTGRMYGLEVDWWLDERRDPYKSTLAAAAYLKKLHNQFGDWYLALAGYNAGEGKVAWAMKRSGSSDFFDIASSRSYFKQETRHYVPKLLAILKIVRNLESLGFEPLSWDAPAKPTEVQARGGTDLMALAAACGLQWSEFKAYNPAFRRAVTPPDKTCPVYLPPDKLEVALAYLEQPESRPYAGYQRYRIRNGDSWWRIASRFGLPVSVLKQVNNASSNLLRPGQWVMIPAPSAGSSVASAHTSPSTAHGSTHVVRKGDSLWKIARRYNVSLSELQQSNGIVGEEVLRIGQKLDIPGRGSQAKTRAIAATRANYVVHKGDTLWDIATQNRVDLTTLVTANGLDPNRPLAVGQKLYIPDYTAKASARSQADAKQVRDRLVSYQVRRGDSLWSIARRFGVETSDLMAWNSISGNELIHPGDDLRVYVP
ncbi:MAG: LysM peptidoglycan-binding domain-containing protein [Desulfohalobiaceae bacterium]